MEEHYRASALSWSRGYTEYRRFSTRMEGPGGSTVASKVILVLYVDRCVLPLNFLPELLPRQQTQPHIYLKLKINNAE